MTEDVERKGLHHRRIDLQFYERADGLYEVEGHLVDRKTHAFRRLLQEQDTPAGEPLHDIIVRLVVDAEFLVHDATASYSASPFHICRGAATTLAPLKGLRMTSGWNKRVRELLAGAASCTHIVELLGQMATTVFQGLAPQRLARIAAQSPEGHKSKVDSCFAFASHREVVAKLWPTLHRPAEKDE